MVNQMSCALRILRSIRWNCKMLSSPICFHLLGKNKENRCQTVLTRKQMHWCGEKMGSPKSSAAHTRHFMKTPRATEKIPTLTYVVQCSQSMEVIVSNI